MEHLVCGESLELNCGRTFPLNVDGSTLLAAGSARIRRVGSIPLLCAERNAAGPALSGDQSP